MAVPRPVYPVASVAVRHAASSAGKGSSFPASRPAAATSRDRQSAAINAPRFQPKFHGRKSIESRIFISSDHPPRSGRPWQEPEKTIQEMRSLD